MVGEVNICSESPAAAPVGQFERDIYALEAAGYATIPDFIDGARIDCLLAQCEEYEAEVDAYVEAGGEVVNPTGWPIKSVRAAWAVSTDVQELIMDPRLQAYARAYLGDPILRDAQFLANMPDPRNADRGVGGKVSYHRDKYWHDEVIKPEYLWCFVLLCDMTPENGGTIVVPGTHRMREPGYYFLNNEPGERIESNAYLVYDRRYFPTAVQVEAKRGSLLLFDPMVIHTQAINVTSEPRRVLNILFHQRGKPGIINCRAIAENHARAPVRHDLAAILENGIGLPTTYGPLR